MSGVLGRKEGENKGRQQTNLSPEKQEAPRIINNPGRENCLSFSSQLAKNSPKQMTPTTYSIPGVITSNLKATAHKRIL